LRRDREGIKELLQHADETFPRLKHLWLDAGYRGEDKGKEWVEKRPWDGAWNSSSVPGKPPPKGY
jgi:hypothetical protein